MLIETILLPFFLAPAILTIEICLHKWRIPNYYQLYRPRWMPKDICFFCLSFWMSLGLAPLIDSTLTIFTSIVVALSVTGILYLLRKL
jgi:hypothetical protein